MSAFAERRARLRELFAEADLDALVVGHLPNVRYLTGYVGSNAILVIGRDAAHVTIFPEPLQVKRATLVFAKGNAGHGTYPSVLRLIAGGRIDPRPMLTAKYPFAEIGASVQLTATSFEMIVPN